MVEEKELIAYAIERIKSVLLGLSSRPVSPLHKGVKVDLSHITGALIRICTSMCGLFLPLLYKSLLLDSWMPPPFHFTWFCVLHPFNVRMRNLACTKSKFVNFMWDALSHLTNRTPCPWQGNGARERLLVRNVAQNAIIWCNTSHQNICMMGRMGTGYGCNKQVFLQTGNVCFRST